MINKISAIGNVNVISRPSFRAEKTKNITNPQPEQKSIEAAANYGMAAVRLGKKFEVEPLIPTIFHPNYTHSINGERIYTSEGRLYSIVNEDDKTKTVYTPNKDDERFFDSIVTADKDSGNVIRRQENSIEDGKYKTMYVSEYSPETGKITASSYYDDGILKDASKYIYHDNGSSEEIIYNYDNNLYYWNQMDSNGKIKNSMEMSKDLKFVTISEYKTTSKSEEIIADADFYNGGLISLSEYKKTVVPNLMGREPVSDPDLKPAEKVNLDGITPDLDGEKTFYSNGAVETITIPSGTAYFTPDGAVSKLVSPTKEIEISENGKQTITEKLGEDESRTTIYTDKEGVEINYEKGDSYKYLRLDKNSRPQSYCQGTLDKESGLTLRYNEHGLLESAFKF